MKNGSTSVVRGSVPAAFSAASMATGDSHRGSLVCVTPLITFPSVPGPFQYKD